MKTLKQIKKGKFKFIESWQFPGEVSEFLEAEMDLWGNRRGWTHVFSGKSKIGDLRIDIDPSNEPDIAADILELPFILGENTQDNIVGDPPWEIPYHNRRMYSYALRDILKPGGILILNCPWSPWVKGLEVQEIWKVTQAFNSYRDLVDIWILKKV